MPPSAPPPGRSTRSWRRGGVRAWWARLAAWLGAPLPGGIPDAPEITRVKVRGYLFAVLAATPGLVMLLHLLAQRGAWVTAALHLSVMVGAVVMFVLVVRRPARLPVAEWVFAGLLTVSGVGFLVLYAQRPEQVLGHDLLGNVMLFIVAGLLLVLPPQASVPVALLLLLAYRTEVRLLSGLSSADLLVPQWVNTGMFALLIVGVIMRQTLSELAGRMQAAQELSVRDPLTGLLNRRGFDAQVRAARAVRAGGSLLVLDVDAFKPINDRFGHAVGDQVLELIGRVLLEHVPGGGVAARWGGEEFIVFTPDNEDGAARLAETVRAAVAATPWNDLRVTVSIGVSGWDAAQAMQHAFLRADDAMYAAKAAGRDRVVRATGDPSLPDAAPGSHHAPHRPPRAEAPRPDTHRPEAHLPVPRPQQPSGHDPDGAPPTARPERCES
ncbi:hypothetical protein GCM10008959_23080 [Deinococcus seoulensis]|uniref:GGDEF domain-containing protein n=1 Tax=Deinococcus seoulensis TaxID=1837379 RepID=A0ABQ2RVI1_9DEIO|nr:GGDEF domain-containing protein [Deinococcus seoulensis]GGR60533.1 hypothetical protein GCM10008959_23080 [Deinococcus seoulensis]